MHMTAAKNIAQGLMVLDSASFPSSARVEEDIDLVELRMRSACRILHIETGEFVEVVDDILEGDLVLYYSRGAVLLYNNSQQGLTGHVIESRDMALKVALGR